MPAAAQKKLPCGLAESCIHVRSKEKTTDKMHKVQLMQFCDVKSRKYEKFLVLLRIGVLAVVFDFFAF